MTLLTALIIQSNDVLCQAGGPDKETGKWAGWIMKNKQRWAPILNTEPIYDSKEEGEKAMRDFVKAIKKLDLSTEKDKLTELLGPEGPLVAKVVEISKDPDKMKK